MHLIIKSKNGKIFQGGTKSTSARATYAIVEQEIYLLYLKIQLGI